MLLPSPTAVVSVLRALFAAFRKAPIFTNNEMDFRRDLRDRVLLEEDDNGEEREDDDTIADISLLIAPYFLLKQDMS